MLLLISPAKTLDFETPVPPAVAARATDPLFAPQAAKLAAAMAKKSARAIAALADLSPALAELNAARWKAWRPQPDDAATKPALLAFAGDVYEGLQAGTLSAAQLDWAQQRLVILSGLYGVLRPLDRIQPYRLEMGTALKTGRAKDLYAFWGDTLAAHLNGRLDAAGGPRVVVNLASVEYARAALRPALAARVVDCVFEDAKPGGWKIVSFFAKRMRGAMARHAIVNRVDRPEGLLDFAAEGYAYAPEASDADRWVFRRRAAVSERIAA